MSEFKVVKALIGVIKGVHTQYVRPAHISASETDINRAFQTTRGFSAISAGAINRANLTNMTTEATTVAPVANSRWKDARSHGVLIVDKIDGRNVERYNVKFYVDKSAVINGAIDPLATLYLDSSTKVNLRSSGLARVQTDIIQRLANSGGLVLPNRVGDRLHATHSSKAGDIHMGSGSEMTHTIGSLGDSSNLSADDSLSVALQALTTSARTLGNRSRSKIVKEHVMHEAICDGAQSNVRETTIRDNDLISHIMGQNNGSEMNLSIQLDKLQRQVGEFEFSIIATEAGDVDYSTTSEMNSIQGATAQHIANEVIGLMVRENISSIRFLATNADGRIEMLCNEGWLVPIRLDAVEGIDREAYRNQMYQTEATIRAQIETLILPKVMNRDSTEVIVDISMMTIASIVMSIRGATERFCLQTGLLSGWSSINISEMQMSTSGMAHKSLLRAINDSLDSQNQDHLGQ